MITQAIPIFIPDADFEQWDLLLAVVFAASTQRTIKEKPKLRITQKVDRELYQAAQRWLPYEASHGDSFDTPWGIYHYRFVVRQTQLAKWRNHDFLKGFEHGATAEVPRRQFPYQQDSYRNGCWDAGYIIGLYARGLDS